MSDTRDNWVTVDNVKVGDKVVIRTKGSTGEDIAVTHVTKVTKTQVIVRRPGKQDATIRYKTPKYGSTMDPVGERSSRFARHSGPYEYTTLRLADKGESLKKTAETIGKREAERKAERDAERKAKEEEQEKAAAERRKKMEAFYEYQGKELLESAPEVDTLIGKVKVLTFHCPHSSERVTMFVRIWEEKDEWDFEARRNGTEPRKVTHVLACGFKVYESSGGCRASSTSWSEGKYKDIVEAVYNIVH